MSLHNKHLFISFSFSILSIYTRRSPGRDFSGKKEENTYICTHIFARGKRRTVDIAVSLIKPIITAIMTLLTRACARARAHGCCKNALTVYRGEKPLRAVCDKKKGPRTPIADATTASVMATKLYSLLFFQPVGAASAIIRLVGTFDLGSSNSRYVSGTQRNAKHTVVSWCGKAAGRPLMHMERFIILNPFNV